MNSSLPKYLAICIPVKGFYINLVEIDMSGIDSDFSLFLAVKTAYEKTKKLRGILGRFLRPISVEFVQVCTISCYSSSS